MLKGNRMHIELTPKAIEKVKGFLASQADVSGLRIYVEGGGCSGFQYGFKLDKKSDEDHVITCDAVEVYVDPFSAPYIKESLLDYNESLMNAGFVIKNPNSKTTCGCGLSFNI